MSKKDSKTKIQKKTTPETTEYQIITLEENHHYQIQHENLLQRVWNSNVLVEDAENAVKEFNKNENILKEWNTYLACDKIPNPFEPQKLRNFFDKFAYFEKEDVKNTINWLLVIDERSILNQDIDSVNRTKKFLKKDRINFGDQYDVQVCDTMELLKRIQKFLETPNKDVSERVLCDIKELKMFTENKICHYIDNLTHRVLSSEAAYMDEIDVTTAEYSYQAQHFDIHLWTFRNVPIFLDPEETPSKIIELFQIKTEIVIPFGVLCENMVIRGVHCCFDHLSSLARYSEMVTDCESERSLKACLQNEWESEKKIQAEVKASLIKERSDFEEALRLKAEEEEQKAKEAQKGDKAKKKAATKQKDNSSNPKKLPKEPPIITMDVVPQVRKNFLELDSQMYTESIIQNHPNKLRLTNGEVNLRHFQILGGVYYINSLSKPKSTNYPQLIMTWYNTDQRIEYKHVKSIFENSQSDDISKFFRITFELPECLCYWSEPIPCHFEEDQSNVVPVSNEFTNSLNVRSPIIVNDFNLHELFTSSMMYDFIENAIPRVISSFKFPEELHEEGEDDKKNKATLGRKKTTTELEKNENELEIKKQFISFDDQNSPERLFPLFKKVLPVVILPMQRKNENEGVHPYENFSDFMLAMESIKSLYKKSTFKDKVGNPVKILIEDYEGNIKKPRITSKLVAYENADGRKSKFRPTLLKSGRESVAVERKSSLKVNERLSIKPDDDKHRKSYKQKINENVLEQEDENDLSKMDEEVKEVKHFSKWSTTNILKSEYNAEKRKVTIWTDRLGTFGFAFNRYQHFPFKSWSLQPFKENPKELEFKIETTFAWFRIYITMDGYKVYVTDFTTNLKYRKTFLDIEEPVKDLKSLKKILQQKFLNIFPEVDAVWYINGDFSNKHLSAELHTYNCMSLNATLLKFHNSEWNKISDRRTMILKLGELKESEQDFCLIRIIPEDVMFIEIKEVNTNLGTNELEYISTWRNIERYADLNQLISSNFDNGNKSTSTDQNIIFHLKNLLHAIRPLSFS